MPDAQKYSITLRPIGTSLGDITLEVSAIDPPKALAIAIDNAREKYPELKSTTFNRFEIDLTS
ncbi:MAG: hypothetical protein KAI40_05940 [Desulfobacterales bacterium]|nr:hypothetical protein [Desulfobacterales bacterium]